MGEEPSPSPRSLSVIAHSPIPRLKGHSKRVSGCPSGREHRLKGEFHEFVSSGSEAGRWTGDSQKSENLPSHKRSHTESSSYFSLGW